MYISNTPTTHNDNNRTCSFSGICAHSAAQGASAGAAARVAAVVREERCVNESIY